MIRFIRIIRVPILISVLVCPSAQTIESIPPPAGYKRIPEAPVSFGNWLRKLPLKEAHSPVLDYRSRIFKAGTDSTVAAVINFDISGERMQQCMDILIRLRAEYLWRIRAFEQISFPLPGGYFLDWISWSRGNRPKFKGIQMMLQQTASPDTSRKNFIRYLHTVFAESHTQQFYHAYAQLAPEQVSGGDFIVKKGTKGHAVMIVDLARDSTGAMVALIGQGDTPACEFYLLNHSKKNPWIPLDNSSPTLPLPISKKMSWDGLRHWAKYNTSSASDRVDTGKKIKKNL